MSWEFGPASGVKGQLQEVRGFIRPLQLHLSDLQLEDCVKLRNNK